jgi:hypothetical protein
VEGASGIVDFWAGGCWAVIGANARKNNRIARPAVVDCTVLTWPTDTPPLFGIYFLLRMLDPGSLLHLTVQE